MSNENSQGYVYILTNPSFRQDWVKIGKSSHPVDVRSKVLGNTAVTLPFEIEHVGQLFDDYKKVKLEIWRTFTDTTLDNIIQ